jgi:hypothetical protein
LPAEKWSTVAEIVEDMFGPCPKPSAKGKSFRRRGGGSCASKKVFFCQCDFHIQAYLNVAGPGITFHRRTNTEFPHDEASSLVRHPVTDEPPIGELLKEVTSGILSGNPKIQPLALWSTIRSQHPETPNSIELFYNYN